LQSHKLTEKFYEGLIKELNAEFADAERQIWETFHQVVATRDAARVTTTDTKSNQENIVNVSNLPAQDKMSVTKKVAAAASGRSVQVELTTGPYAGETFLLKPTEKAPSLVGRSKNKNLRTKGISLPKDLEVSTTHGQFELLDGKLCFTDLQSTNGTWVKSVELSPNEPLELVDGIEIIVGQTLMKITLCDLLGS
jgi:hypothetical protein